MPLYDYHCPECGNFRAWAPMSESDSAQPCPECAKPGARALSAPAIGGDSAKRDRMSEQAFSGPMPKAGGCCGGGGCSH